MAGPTTARRDPAGGRRPDPRPSSRVYGRPTWRRVLHPRAVLSVALLLAVLAGFGTWVLYGSPWLRVERVEAHGTEVLTPERVLRAADIPRDTALASVDPGDVAGRLKARLPRIKSVSVKRVWPHRVTLTVTERTPAVLLRGGDRYTEVDADGVRFATVAKRPAGVPVLRLDARKSPSLGRFGPGRLRTAGVRVAGQLPAAVRKETRTIKVTSYDAITLELTGGRTVLWGSAEDGAAKAKALTALMKAARDAGHFDVSAPSAPAVS